jgi:HK97 family phage portal protein
MSRYEVIRRVRPSLLDRLRSITLGPWNPKDRAIAQYFGGRPASSGVSVNDATALNYSAWWAGVRLVSGSVASLPLKLYRYLPDGGRQIFDTHPLYRIVSDSPNPEMSAYTFRETLQAHAMTWGNAYAEIERDGANRPKYLWPITPERVTVERDRGELRYRVLNDDGRAVYLDAANVLHIPGLGYDGTVGYSVIAKARESIGLGLAAERFGGTFFGEGAWFGGLFTTDKAVDEKTKKNFLDAMNSQHQGVDKAHRVGLVGGGLKFTQLGIPPDDAQFLETRQFQVSEIARWFGIPPHMLADLERATFSNIEQQNLEYLQNCLDHWLIRWEQILILKLISPLERNQQFIEFVREGILRGDSAGRAQLESAHFNIGAVTPNEIRRFENRNPVDGGEKAFVQAGYMPLDLNYDWWQAEIDLKKADAEAKRRPPEPPPTVSPNDEADRAALRAAVAALEQSLLSERAAKEQEAEAKRVAQQRAEDLSDALAHLEEKRHGLEQELAHALELYDGAKVALGEAHTEHARQIEGKDGEIARLTAGVAELRQQIEALQADIRSIEAVALKAGEERDAVGAALAQEQAERVAEEAKSEERLNAALLESTAARMTAFETDEKLRAEQARCNEATERAETAEAAYMARGQELDDVRALLEKEQVARAAEAKARGMVEQELDAAYGLRETAVANEAAAIQRAEKAEAEREALQAVLEEANGMLRESDARLAEAVAVRSEAEALRAAATLRAEAAERDKAIAEQAQRAANATLETMQARHAERLTRLLAATRALIVEAMGRIIRRETEKARRNQATGEKLRHWMGTFYVLHEENCIEILQPAVRAHLALIGSPEDPATYVQTLVREQIAESIRQLEAAASVEPSEFQVVLAKMLNRWETQRPDAVADRLLTEGLDHVRSQQ